MVLSSPLFNSSVAQTSNLQQPLILWINIFVMSENQSAVWQFRFVIPLGSLRKAYPRRVCVNFLAKREMGIRSDGRSDWLTNWLTDWSICLCCLCRFHVSSMSSIGTRHAVSLTGDYIWPVMCSFVCGCALLYTCIPSWVYSRLVPCAAWDGLQHRPYNPVQDKCLDESVCVQQKVRNALKCIEKNKGSQFLKQRRAGRWNVAKVQPMLILEMLSQKSTMGFVAGDFF